MGFKDHIWSQIGGTRREKKGRERERAKGEKKRKKMEESRSRPTRYGFYDLCMELGIDLNGYMFVGCGL